MIQKKVTKLECKREPGVGAGRDVVWIMVAFCVFCEDEKLQTHKERGM